MHWWQILLMIVFGLLGFFIAFSLIYVRKTTKSLAKDEFKKQMRNGQLIDVRSPREFYAGHIPGAKNIHLALLTKSYAKIRRDKPIYLYCQDGKTSKRAAAFLMAKGFNEVYILDQGLKSWTDPLKK